MTLDRLAILSTWPRDLGRGTGVAMALVNLAHGLGERGVEVSFPMEPIPPDTPMGIERTRSQLRQSLRPMLEPLPEVCLAVDFDGHRIPGRGQGGTAVKILHVRTNFLEMLELCPDYDLPNMRLRAAALLRNIETADALVTSSRHTLEHLRRACPRLPRAQAIVPNAVDTRLAAALDADTTPRDEVPLVVGYGKALWRKDYATAVAASNLLARRGVQHRMELLVYGSLVPQLESMAEGPHVAILPTTSDRVEMAALLRRAWVVCHPAVQEDFGNVYLEAAVAGVPVVAARIGVTVEHGIEPHFGRLADPHDVEAFADGMEWAITRRRSEGFPPRLRLTHADRTWTDAADELVEFAEDVLRSWARPAPVPSRR